MHSQRSNFAIGVDIGGSHVSAGLVDVDNHMLIDDTMVDKSINAKMDPIQLLDSWCYVIKGLLKSIPADALSGIGIAIPGPFDYKNGISLIRNVAKYEQLYGIHVKQYLSDQLHISNYKIHFLNDATAFALGSYKHLYGSDKKRILALTLGTGFGSTFVYDGNPQIEMLYNQPYKDSIVDDYFSTRWFVKQYGTVSAIENVKQLYDKALQKDEMAIQVFEEFGKNLGLFLDPILVEKDIETVIIGGSICKASAFFESSIWSEMNAFAGEIVFGEMDVSGLALLGAGVFAGVFAGANCAAHDD
jgi:glucokinase